MEGRERIATDLHDTVIQRLFATGMSLQGSVRLVESDPTGALKAALEPDGPQVAVEISPPESASRAIVRARLTCHPIDPSAAETYSGAVTALMVRSGRQPITELLVSVQVRDENARHAATVVRRFLEHLTAHMGEPAA